MNMMGVVLWSDLDDQKAVFWCEDQGDLAFYDASTDRVAEGCQLNPGDMVRFDVSLERKIRRARNAQVLEQSVCNGIQNELRKSAAVTEPVDRNTASGDVIQLRARAANRPVLKRAITASCL